VAADLLADNLDTYAAITTGDVKASGLLSLIGEFNALLDRVGYYLA
jgi:hypothetical protein